LAYGRRWLVASAKLIPVLGRGYDTYSGSKGQAHQFHRQSIRCQRSQGKLMQGGYEGFR
jgi:hypothetical protein